MLLVSDEKEVNRVNNVQTFYVTYSFDTLIMRYSVYFISTQDLSLKMFKEKVTVLTDPSISIGSILYALFRSCRSVDPGRKCNVVWTVGTGDR